jgi:SAM-dependent methyltransferase
MGRFSSTVQFYIHREPYPRVFFQAIAQRLALDGDETLLDVGCGPGPLSIGLAPFVKSCVGLDPEPAMAEAARAAAEAAGVDLTVRLGRLEEFPAGEIFDLVTIGRALHWLDRPAALQVLDRIVSRHGRVLICSASTVETPAAQWLKPYQEIRRLWTADREIGAERYRVKPAEWFAGSPFVEIENVSATHTQHVGIADLVARALSKSTTSPAVLGRNQTNFEAEIRAALEPFSRDGVLEEEIVSRAAVFGRMV